MDERDRQQLADELAELPQLVAELTLQLLPGGAGEGRSAALARPPLRLEVLALIDDRLDKPVGVDEWGARDADAADLDRRAGDWRLGVPGVLWHWTMTITCRLADAGVPYTDPGEDTQVGRSSRWLVAHLDQLDQLSRIDGGQQLVDALIGDVRRLHHRLRLVLGYRDDPYRCPDCGWTIDQQGKGEQRGAWFRCRGCGRTWTLAAEVDRLLAAQADVMTLGKAAERLHVSRQYLHRLIARTLRPVARQHGRPVYRLRDIQRVLDRTTKASRPKSKRSRTRQAA